MRKKHKIIFVSILMVALATSYLLYKIRYDLENNKEGLIAVLSASSDGRFVFSTDNKNVATLWDAKQKKRVVISSISEIYSAYWIKKTPYFMWQDKNEDGKISVENADTLKLRMTMQIPYMIFGQVMSSDLKHYAFSDANWTVFTTENDLAKIMIRNYNDIPGFDGANKLINFTLLGNDKLLTSGLTYASPDDPTRATGVDLWDLKTRKKIRSYIGNIGKTFATLSPDGKYVVSGDEGGSVFVWKITGEPYLVVDDLIFGNDVKNQAHSLAQATDSERPLLRAYYKRWHLDTAEDDSDDIVPEPKDFGDNSAANRGIISIKFIDDTHYLTFISRTDGSAPYAILYDIDSPRALKYLPLGKHPMPALSYYERDQAIDTSPSAHILVMAKENKPGILVYQYDPQKQTLTKIWDGK